MTRNLPLDKIRKQAEAMEHGATQFYEKAAERATDVGVQRLLDDLAIVEKGHGELAQKQKLTEANVPPDVSNAEDATSQRMSCCNMCSLDPPS